MSVNLLNRFIDEECNDAIKSSLIADIENEKLNKNREIKEYNFNIFNIYVNFKIGKVIIEDEISHFDVNGQFEVSLTDFVNSLQ